MGEDHKVVSFEKYQAKRELEREVRIIKKIYEEKPVDELIRLHDQAKRLQTIWQKVSFIGEIGFLLLIGVLVVQLALGSQLQLMIPVLILSIGFLICAVIAIPNKQKYRLTAAHAKFELVSREGMCLTRN